MKHECIDFFEPDECLKQVYDYDRDDNYETKAANYVKKSELGDIFAMYNLGTLYEKGKWVSQDYEKAAALYMEVADYKNRGEFICADDKDYCVYPQYAAEYALGRFYEKGLLPNSSMEKAVEWYLRAQNDGSNEADWKLVECYLEGTGVEQNYDMAAETLDSAHRWSNGQDARSFTFAKMLDEKTETHQLHICKILAECYSNGIGTVKDEERAIEYHEKAIALKLQQDAKIKLWYEKIMAKHNKKSTK